MLNIRYKESRLLIQSIRGNWCIYRRDPKYIPQFVERYAHCIYDYDNNKCIKNRAVNLNLPENLDDLPVAENIFTDGLSFVRGIFFDGDYIGQGEDFRLELINDVKIKY